MAHRARNPHQAGKSKQSTRTLELIQQRPAVLVLAQTLAGPAGVTLLELADIQVRVTHVVACRRRLWDRLISDLGWTSGAIAALWGVDYSTVSRFTARAFKPPGSAL